MWLRDDSECFLLFFNTTSMKAVLLETVLREALVLCQPEFLGVKVYIRAKKFWVLPTVNQIEGIITVCKVTKMNKKFILTLIFSSVKVSGKTLYSFQRGLSFNRTKIIVKKVQVVVATEASSFKKHRIDNRREIVVRMSIIIFVHLLRIRK